MVETTADRHARLREAPKDPSGLGGGYAEIALLEHIAFSLWRVATMMEQDREKPASGPLPTATAIR